MANEKIIHIDLISPRDSVYSGEAISITVPGAKGAFQILYSHAPIVSTLDIGIITIEEPNGTKKRFAISGGLLELSANVVSAIVEDADEASTINIESARKALAQAENMLESAKDEYEKNSARKLIAKAKNLIKAKETV